MTEFGRKVEGYREGLGIRQNALAQRVGLSPAHLNRIEKGTRKPPHVEVVLAMIEALYLNPEQAKEFIELAGYSPQVLQLNGAQAATQVVPVQQPPAATGIEASVLQQILTLLQQLTGTVGQLTAAVVQQQAQVAALLQQLKTAPPTPLDSSEELREGVQPSVNQGYGKATAAIVRKKEAVELDDHIPLVEEEKMGGVVVMDWNMEDRPTRNLDEGAMWDEIWTTIYEQPGDLRVVMRGLQGMTLLPGHYEKRAKPILEGERGSAAKAFIASAFERVERRRIAFERQVQEYEYWHITPIAAFDRYVETGIHRPEDWTYVLGGNPASPEQRAADIRHIIHLLETHNNYHLGLFTGTDSENIIYKVSFWELKAGHTLLLENLESGERNVKNTEASLTAWFRELYERFWKSEGMITDKEKVINRLEMYARVAVAPH